MTVAKPADSQDCLEKMDDGDLVFVPSGGQSDGDAAAEVFEDFVELKGDDFSQDDAQVRSSPSIPVMPCNCHFIVFAISGQYRATNALGVSENT